MLLVRAATAAKKRPTFEPRAGRPGPMDEMVGDPGEVEAERLHVLVALEQLVP
jgi:hypothetical protein